MISLIVISSTGRLFCLIKLSIFLSCQLDIRVGDARQTRLNIDGVVSFLLIISTNARLEWPKILGLAGNGPFTRTYLIAGYSRGEAFRRRETRSNGEHRSGEEGK